MTRHQVTVEMDIADEETGCTDSGESEWISRDKEATDHAPQDVLQALLLACNLVRNGIAGGEVPTK